jgi:outer membrane protein TolC
MNTKSRFFVAALLRMTMLLCVSSVAFADDAVISSTEPVKTLSDCLDLGRLNFEPLRLADEEVEVARLKRQEAYRAFYPVVGFKGEVTNGKTEDPTASPEFRERIYGATLTQSLFEGGKITATYRQAVASHEAAERSREKTYQDFLYSVDEAYWKLVAAQFAFGKRSAVFELIKKDLEVMTEQYVQDLAVKQQFLSVKSQYLQASSQVNGARIALTKARWALARALGLSQPVDFNLPTEIPFKKIEPDVQECLSLAAGHRPDLVMQESLAESAFQSLRVASAADRPKLSLNAFYGRSASAYVSDPLTYRDDWQVFARLSQSLFGNSVAMSGSKVNTSPRLGQSTRSNTETATMNVNILDNMRDRTDTKQADLSYRQAKLKRDDLRKDVAIEVEESVFNVTQAAMQVEFTEEDEKLAQEELNVAESKGKYGLAGTLEMAQARNRLAASQAGRIDALGGYQIAVAGLNRAIGISDKFKIE